MSIEVQYRDEIKALVITLGDLRRIVRRLEKTKHRDLLSSLDSLIEGTMERKRVLICERQEHREFMRPIEDARIASLNKGRVLRAKG